MKKSPLFIFLLFATLSLGFTLSAFYHTVLKSDPTDAGGFGISPPYFGAMDIKPGETKSQTIRVLRSEDKGDQIVRARLIESEVSDWFNILPSEEIVIADGENSASFTIELKVPSDAQNGEYESAIYFVAVGDKKDGSVSIQLGARANVGVEVVGGQDRFTNISDTSDSLTIVKTNENTLAERLKGYFIIRSEDKGQIYYLHPERNELYIVSSVADLFNIIENEARGINNDLLGQIKIEGAESEETEISDIAKNLGGTLLLAVEDKGRVWYVNPRTNKRVELKNDIDLAGNLSSIVLGISENNYQILAGF